MYREKWIREVENDIWTSTNGSPSWPLQPKQLYKGCVYKCRVYIWVYPSSTLVKKKAYVVGGELQ